MKKTNVYEDRDSLGMAAANLFVWLSAQAIAKHGKCIVALSGGSTPDAMFLYLSSDEYASIVEWDKFHFFWSDERYVDFDDEENNSNRAIQNFLSKVNVNAEHVHRVQVNEPAEVAASLYEEKLKEICGEKIHLDICYLGMGDDGHVASVFPGSQLVQLKEKGVRAELVESLNRYRITFTLPLINSAENIVFLVSGKNKADAFEALESREKSEEELPVLAVNQDGDNSVYWLLTGDVLAE